MANQNAANLQDLRRRGEAALKDVVSKSGELTALFKALSGGGRSSGFLMFLKRTMKNYIELPNLFRSSLDALKKSIDSISSTQEDVHRAYADRFEKAKMIGQDGPESVEDMIKFADQIKAYERLCGIADDLESFGESCLDPIYVVIIGVDEAVDSLLGKNNPRFEWNKLILTGMEDAVGTFFPLSTALYLTKATSSKVEVQIDAMHQAAGEMDKLFAFGDQIGSVENTLRSATTVLVETATQAESRYRIEVPAQLEKILA